MNKVILIGRLTRDPEIKHIPSGSAVATFGLAVDKFSKEEGGRSADFFDIVCWEKRAEFASKWLKKGTKIALSGRLSQRSWKDKEGNNRSSIEIVADELEFAESKNSAENTAGNYQPYPMASQGYNKPSIEPSSFQELHDDDGELPF